MTVCLVRSGCLTKEWAYVIKSSGLLAVFLFVVFVFVDPARAALGGDEASITLDQTAFNGTRRILKAQKFTTHEILADSGTLIREYIAAEGPVFAVVWKGPVMPDLEQILGNYFSDYQSAVQNGRVRRAPVLIQQPELVIRSEGHMRAFSGHAYLPQRLPADVTIDEIQ